MDAKTIEWIIFTPLIVGLLLISWWATTESHRRLNDPNNNRTVHLDQLPDKLALFAHGIYRVTVFRQSGNIHAEQIVTGTAQQALAIAMATFRRANIDAVHIGANTETKLRIGRLYHDHRGSNEGKKVGKATIALLERISLPPEPEPIVQAHAPEPSITFQYVGITCDCGERFDLASDDLPRERLCKGCGKDATLNAAQITQIGQAAADARVEALERHRAGETDIQVGRRNKLTETDGGLTAANIKHEAAQEAVMRLAYLKPEAIPVIVSLMKDGMAEHPRAIATAYRKDGDQLSVEEKKAAGIRANAFMSRRAFGDLSDKGKANPLAAHEVTLLRAMFAENRFNRIVSHGLTDDLMRYFDGFKYDTLTRDCPFCGRVDGTVVKPEEVSILPALDCTCETANYRISPQVGWLKGVE